MFKALYQIAERPLTTKKMEEFRKKYQNLQNRLDESREEIWKKKSPAIHSIFFQNRSQRT